MKKTVISFLELFSSHDHLFCCLFLSLVSKKERKYIFASIPSLHPTFAPLSLHFSLFLYLQSSKLPFFFIAPWSFPTFTSPLRFAIHLCVDLHFVQKSWMKLLLMKIRWLPWQATKEPECWHDSSPTDQFTAQATSYFIISYCHYMFFYQEKLLWDTGSKCPVRKEQPHFHF